MGDGGGPLCVVCCLDLLVRERGSYCIVIKASPSSPSSSREGKETKISSNTFIISSVYSSRAVQEQYATILFKYNTYIELELS